MSNLVGMWTLTHREVSRMLRVWKQTIVPPVLTAVLFILIFGYSLGSRISSVEGFSYINFILPGLLMMGVIMSAYSNTSSSLFLSKFQGNIQEILVAPISYGHIIMSLTIAGVIRGLLVGAGILGVGLLFTKIPVHNAWVLLFFIILVSLVFSLAGIVTALWATDFDGMTVFLTFLITPLTYLGGVFYSINMLPDFWRTVALFNPILYMVDGFRYGFLGFSDVPLMHSFIIVIALNIFFFMLCVHLFRIGYKLRK